MRCRPFTFRTAACVFLIGLVIHADIAASYKTEVEITPAPPLEEATTKKSGFFGGIKSFFRGSATTTTTPLPPITGPKADTAGSHKPATPAQPLPPAAAGAGQHSPPPSAGGNRPPPLNFQPGGSNTPHAPLQPLGPRPDTPSSSPWGGNPNQPPQWPHANAGQTTHGAAGGHQPTPTGSSSATPPADTPKRPLPGGSPPASYAPNQGAASANMPPGFQHFQPPSNRHGQPSGIDLSYGGSFPPGQRTRPGAGSGLHLASTTVATPMRPVHPSVHDRDSIGQTGQHGQAGHSTPSSPGAGGPANKPGLGLHGPGGATSPIGSTTPNSDKPFPNIDLRGNMGGPTISAHNPGSPTPKTPTVKEDFPALPGARRPSSQDEFPLLPAPKSPSPTPGSPVRPSSPSAWNVPLSTPATPVKLGPPAPSVPAHSGSNGVSFIADPKDSGSRSPSTTARPGATTGGQKNVATDDELRALAESLYTKEVNNQLSLITVNPQGKTRSIDSGDEAPQPLLQVDSKAFEPPTIAKMRALLNNYEDDITVNEHVTANEHKEENDFVDAVMATSVMRQAMQFLQNKNLVSPDPKTHRDLVKELWFTQYSRGGGRIGSSGFEHVFVNEVKNGTIIGLHNWVYFHEEEKAGRLDYKGYMNQLEIGKTTILKVRFVHNGLNKPVNTLFIGSSPELEMALYTVCFMLRPDRTCPVSMNNKKFGIVTYTWRYRGKTLIGSAYPEI